MSHNVTVAPRAAFASKENKQDGGLAVNFVTKLLMEENLIYQNNIIIIIETMSKKTTNRIWVPSAKKKRKEKVKCETNSVFYQKRHIYSLMEERPCTKVGPLIEN